MTAIVFTALILTVSAAFGYGVSRFAAVRRPSKWIVVPSSIFLALTILIFAGNFYFQLGEGARFTDDPDLLADSTLEIRGFHGTLDQAAGLPNRSPDCFIRVHYRSDTKVGDDFVVRLDTNVSEYAPVAAHFSVPDDWKLRPSGTCKSGKSSDACALAGLSNSVNWIVRPEQPSNSIWEFSISSAGHEWCTSPWFALFYENGSLVTTRPSRSYDRPSTSWGSMPNEQFSEASVATNTQPTLQGSGWDVNLSDLTIRGKTQVVQTIGVSSSTYAYLALFGAIGSSALGSGWLISLISYLLSKLRKKSSSESES